MKKSISLLFIAAFTLVISSCGGENKTDSKETEETEATDDSKTSSDSPESYDPKRGEGKFSSENVIVAATLDAAMATYGEAVSGTKCLSCHKLTDEKLVGPGWKGVTERRKPEWIMNFITNPDPMIDKDPEAQAMLEICLVRMPNQNLADNEARSILEYMRKIDGVK
ncbi:MAG: c-type cytochrome [Bacteroidia bacterium]